MKKLFLLACLSLPACQQWQEMGESSDTRAARMGWRYAIRNPLDRRFNVTLYADSIVADDLCTWYHTNGGWGRVCGEYQVEPLN